MPLAHSFFQSDRIDEHIRSDLQQTMIEVLVSAAKVMTQEDKADKILPIMLEVVKDDGDEEKRILGLDMIDKMAEMIGKDIC